MALSVSLKRVTNLPGQHERQATMTFRGFTHKTRNITAGSIADFGEHFRWPHYGNVANDEVLTVKVYNCSKVFTNRSLGKLIISLQTLSTSGRLVLTESLVDKNYSITGINVELDIRYQPAQGAVGAWVGNDFFTSVEDRVDIEEEACKKDRQAVRIGKSLMKGSDDEYDSFDEADLQISGITFSSVLSRCSIPVRDSAANPKPRNFKIAVTVIQAQKLVGVNIDPMVYVKIGDEKKHTAVQKATNCPFYNEYFLYEFCEPRDTVFEKLIEISVVHVKKIRFLNTRLGTFKIDAGTVYNNPDHRFLQKWAVITDPKDTRAGIKGFVKCNLSIVTRGDSIAAPPSTGSQNDDVEKNLLLPKRIPAERPWSKLSVKIFKAEGLPSMNDGIMGSFSKMMGEKKVFIDPYVQVTFAGQQGETSVESDTNAPEWNEQISFIELFPPLVRKIKIQVLDDATTGDVTLATHFIDLQQISDPNKNAGFNPTFGPTWVNFYGSPQNYTLRDVHKDLNEGRGEGIFYRGRILVAVTLDIFTNNNIQEKKPLQALKNAFSKFKMKRKSKKLKEKEKKEKESAGAENTEDAEGEQNNEQPDAVTVGVDDILPLPKHALGVKEEFLLYGVFFEVTMMDPSIGNNQVKFEISIGNYGKAAEIITKASKKKGDAVPEERQGLLDASSEDELSVDFEGDSINNDHRNKSVTPLKTPEHTQPDGSYLCIQMGSDRPCVHVWSYWEDHSWRLYSSNWIVKIAERLEHGLDEVEKLTRRPESDPEIRLKQVLKEFIAGCRQYSLNAGKKTMARPNNLDRCRIKSLPHNISLYAKQALRASRKVTKHNVKEKINNAKKILEKVRFLAKEPQCTLPDVLIWMFSNNKRVAYARIQAQNILYSIVEEEKGKDCGKISTIYFKIPGSYNGEIFAKAELYLWLGVTKYAKNSTADLPEDYRLLYERDGQLVESPTLNPPVLLQRDDYRYFQLRAHLYQARGILPADDNGLSDTFARVIFGNLCQSTKVINETLAPMWNEMLIYDNLLLDGNKEDIRNDPPLIIINVFDQDKFGKPDFVGRAFAIPIVLLLEDEDNDGDGQKYIPPALQLFDIFKGNKNAGELIAAFELIELENRSFMREPAIPEYVTLREPEFADESMERYIIPQGIRPVLKEFRIEILFWGLRDLQRIHLFEVEQPQVRIECSGKIVESEVILSYKEFPNFTELVKCVDVELPEQVYLHPPLSIFVVEKRSFGRSVMVGSTMVSHLMKFAQKELEEISEETEDKPKQKKVLPRLPPPSAAINVDDEKHKKFNPLNIIRDPLKSLGKTVTKDEELEEECLDPEELDWWSKYYESMKVLTDNVDAPEDDEEGEEDENEEGGDGVNIHTLDAAGKEEIAVEIVKPKRKVISTLKIYKGELENEFDNFEDWLHTFILKRGKALDDDDGNDDDNFMGKYKGSFYIYPSSEATDEFQIMRGVPRNRPVKVLVRIYIVKATNLAPADPNGKADPYVIVKVGEHTVDSKERYIPKQLNPVFGEVFEMTISFPAESELTISVFDHDLIGSDDLIGETKLDLENRFYSSHRPNCGLALQYDVEGYNAWRDAFRPSQILTSLCKKHSLPAPEYRREEVKVNTKIFKIPNFTLSLMVFMKDKNKEDDGNLSAYDEHKALHVLQHWDEMPEYGTRLVPEHVEVRTLYNSKNPGLGQGSLHMWIDMFPNDVPPPPPVNIKRREPVSYELRVIIWNTDDVILDDVNPFTGTPSSDIYVKGWIRGLNGDKQETDVHFNSLTGEGNFNWRFVYRFDYLPTEKEITYKKKESIFSIEETEYREPAFLELQVWDYDRISANDFLGSIELKLGDMVRGAKTAGQCTIKMAKDKATPRFSIFRNKRMRGWWPFVKLRTEEEEEREEPEAKDKKSKKKKKKKNVNLEDVQYTDSSGNIYILAGKVEAEFQLLTVEEAEKSPVGLGRKEPEPLDKPNRPKTSFNWFVNPLKTLVFFIWRNYKKYIIALVIIAILTIFLVLILYTMPGFISEKIING
ncbi:LOW QUALITY PROTEIN: fer-1-like protein 4 [Bufo gargarizans]|uniref:LOW QUALITY PROTEIN: fer-1-like protein 4 n=1 Tax=Bufo gargarizans TaxID=30331 RepID=UPI001CF0F4D3|nr:LOW QUALITY PROTEIN: fer-1-like protein 4 [Bufo gargarizans]